MKNHLIKALIIVGVLILQVGLAYAVIKYLLPPGKSPIATDSSSVVSSEDQQKQQEEQKKEKEKEKEKEKKKKEKEHETWDDLEISEISKDEMEKASSILLEDVVVNPAGSGGNRFLIVTLKIFLKEPLEGAEADLKLPAIKDDLGVLLASKESDWLVEVYNRDVLRHEIMNSLRKILGDEMVLRVFFEKFVVQ